MSLYPLVGAHFRPPAKLVLAQCPQGTTLALVPEPENPYDPGAIAVYLDFADFPDGRYSDLEHELIGTGFEVNDLFGQTLRMGYIGAEGGKPCRKLGLPGNANLAERRGLADLPWEELVATLTFHETGDPLVKVEGL